MRLSISRRGVEFERTPRQPEKMKVAHLSFNFPETLYRLLARRTIHALLVKNRRLRHAAQVHGNRTAMPGLFERLVLAYLDRRYPPRED